MLKLSCSNLVWYSVPLRRNCLLCEAGACGGSSPYKSDYLATKPNLVNGTDIAHGDFPNRFTLQWHIEEDKGAPGEILPIAINTSAIWPYLSHIALMCLFTVEDEFRCEFL